MLTHKLSALFALLRTLAFYTLLVGSLLTVPGLLRAEGDHMLSPGEIPGNITSLKPVGFLDIGIVVMILAPVIGLFIIWGYSMVRRSPLCWSTLMIIAILILSLFFRKGG